MLIMVMKKCIKAIFLIFCIFIQSCYTYKHIELNGIKENDRLKISLKTTKLLKGETISVNKEFISFKSKKQIIKSLNHQLKEFEKESYQNLKILF